MGGTTITVKGETIPEVLRKLADEIEKAENQFRLYVDSRILLLENEHEISHAPIEAFYSVTQETKETKQDIFIGKNRFTVSVHLHT